MLMIIMIMIIIGAQHQGQHDVQEIHARKGTTITTITSVTTTTYLPTYLT